MTTLRLPRRVTLLLLAVAGALLTVMATATPAMAHAVLVQTDPVDGDIVPTAPARIVLTFNEPVSAVPEATTVLDAGGAPQPVTVRAVDSSLQITPDVALADGTHIVTWRVISADSHPVSGAFTFSVGSPSPQSVMLPDQTAPVGVVWARGAAQGLTYLGVFVAGGLVLFELVFLDATPGRMPRSRRRLRRLASVGGAVGVTGAWLSVPLTALWQAGAGWPGLGDSAFWRSPAISELGLAAAVTTAGVLLAVGASSSAWAVPVTTARPTAGRWGPGAAGGRGLGAAGVTLAGTSLLLTGHTRSFGPAWLVLAADAMHVLAGIVWVGGVLGLVIVLRADSDTSPRRAATTLVRFSCAAAWPVAAVAAAGLTLAWRILGSVNALLGTDYGQVLLVKTGLVLVVVALAGYNRYRLLPRISVTPDRATPRPLRLAVRAEGALLVLVLLLTGFLTGRSPVPATAQPGATGVSGASGTAGASGAAAFSRTQPLGSGTITARLTPAGRGSNVLELTLLDADRRPLRPVAAPTVSLRLTRADGSIGPLTHPVSAVGVGRYQSNVDFPLDGPWTIEVAVRTSKFEEPIVTFSVEIP